MSTTSNVFERPARAQRRVVVTGIGSINPLGLTAEESFKSAVEGKSGIAPITLFDASKMPVTFAGEVKGFNADTYIAKKEQKKMDRFIHLALAAADMAVKNSGLNMSPELGESAGAIVGVGIGGLPTIEEQHKTYLERGPGRLSPFFIPSVITNLAGGQISIQYHLKGPNYAVTSACASGNHSIGEAAQYIRNGLCKVMIAGGSESTICPLAVGGFASMRALSTRNDNPAMASRPWDKDRDGFVMGEGAGILILEDYEHASKRGAKIYCELKGYGVSSDAFHITNPAPKGAGAALAMQAALKDGNVKPESIDYINAHGTSTPVGDLIETEAIKTVFSAHAKKLWVSSTKSMTGHLLGAAGAIESVFCVQSLHHGIVPPTINLDHTSEGCDLDYVPAAAREKKMKAVLNNSFGFGGTNACLIFTTV